GGAVAAVTPSRVRRPADGAPRPVDRPARDRTGPEGTGRDRTGREGTGRGGKGRTAGRIRPPPLRESARSHRVPTCAGANGIPAEREARSRGTRRIPAGPAGRQAGGRSGAMVPTREQSRPEETRGPGADRAGLGPNGVAGGSAGSVQSVDRAVSVLEILARLGEAGVTEIAGDLGVHKSTASRLLGVLENRGLVTQSHDRGKYRLGAGVLRLAGAAAVRLDISQEGVPVCRELADELCETVNLAVLDDDAAV